ncbi:phosphatidylglycerol lysyltransferase domain-containing protein [Rhizomonospora bruguierae]|uniref:phosphatidylglycerol lysyltransferase domain-containing protein n=1 Tax=Rhizomonospora bruguierae TaxID=1581705 RepID=UPI001BCF423E|nr:phosphatidylglycerol lysyltransferase domain-containing protein [Micromonospora sp. NBRC 107566]
MRAWGPRAAGALSVGAAVGCLTPLGAALPTVDRWALAGTLLVLGRGLLGRRRLAWQAGLALVALLALLPPHRPGRFLALGAVAVLLIAGHAQYVARPDPRRLRAAAYAGLGALTLVVGHGLWLSARDRTPVRQVAHAALTLPSRAAARSDRVFLLAVVLAALLALALAFAPAPPPPADDEATRARVRDLVRHPDSGSLAPFATRADRAYVFSDDGAAAIGYRVVWGVALAGGDPVGAAASAPAAVAAFGRLCERRGWRPAVLGADAADAGVWRAAGPRRGVEIGDEAVLDVAGFSLATRRMRNVRQAVRRTHLSGVRVDLGVLDASLARRLAPVLENWLRGRAERGFAMNLDRILAPRADVLVAVAYDRAGAPQAFARFAVAGGGAVLSLDVAPRRLDAPNGVVERLIVEAAGYGRERGVREVSLNFAGMRRAFVSPGRMAALARIPLHVLDRWIELRPLWRFTAKFHPRWRPRLLLLCTWWDLPRVGPAALLAEFGRHRPAAPGRDLPQEAGVAP